MASTLLSTADVATFLETNLKATDAELERFIDSADRAIQEVYGPHVDGERTVRIESNYNDTIFLPYPPAESVSEVREYEMHELSTDSELVPDDEYELEFSGRAIRRGKKYFEPRVTVTYQPVDDTVERRHMLIDLVKLADQYSAVKIDEFGIGRSGGASTEHLPYTAEWESILLRLRPFSQGIWFV